MSIFWSQHYHNLLRQSVNKADWTAHSDTFVLNGVSTQQENIADNGGMSLSYIAYQDWVKRNLPEPTLPGLNYSSTPLFWISAASTFCEKETPEFMRNLIATDSHSIPEFRVIGPNSNRPEFAEDFNCLPGSAITPDEKCLLW
ncbi:neprilysin-2-like [Belonocnema kinseyi]|uniref:neprilysin-2-like n=1 Tax=Belonocnema kinseyi TaxID=2817044 RepID=UPI00143D4AA1|nr:neprilysin-2-like [Belonocnema kinseyi]XP_033211870.1 neprilysin-2-like [Belonocnema kinseyi]XP_033211871.1 neprilysin-2-like [Belonocnema kinseyi]